MLYFILRTIIPVVTEPRRLVHDYSHTLLSLNHATCQDKCFCLFFVYGLSRLMEGSCDGVSAMFLEWSLKINRQNRFARSMSNEIPVVRFLLDSVPLIGGQINLHQQVFKFVFSSPRRPHQLQSIPDTGSMLRCESILKNNRTPRLVLEFYTFRKCKILFYHVGKVVLFFTSIQYCSRRPDGLLSICEGHRPRFFFVSKGRLTIRYPKP